MTIIIVALALSLWAMFWLAWLGERWLWTR